MNKPLNICIVNSTHHLKLIERIKTHQQINVQKHIES